MTLVWMAARRQLVKRTGRVRARRLVAEARLRSAAERSSAAALRPAALRRHRRWFLDPALALYRTLRAHNWSEAEALPAVERAVLAPLLPWRRLFRLLGRFPFFFDLLRRVTPGGVRDTFPDPAWRTEWLELSDDAIAFRFHRCWYLSELTRRGAPELVPLFCRLDRLFYDDVSPWLRFERHDTLALTGRPCDFRFTRIRSTGPRDLA